MATIVVDCPLPSVIEKPGANVIAGTAAASVEKDEPICTIVCDPDVCKATTVADDPLPSVMGESGARVWPEITKAELGPCVITVPPMLMTGANVIAGAAPASVEKEAPI